MQAVLLDLDDTLTDRAATLRAYAARFLADFGDRLRVSDPAHVASELARIDRNGYNPARAADIAAHAAFTESPGAAVIAEHWDRGFVELTVARPGLHATLDALSDAGLRLGVVTNGPTHTQRAKVEQLGLTERLGAVLVSESFGAAKPDPSIFLAAAAELGVLAQHCAFVGDNPQKDVVGAAAVGMRAIWMRATVPWPPELPVPTDAIAELPELLPLLGVASRAAD